MNTKLAINLLTEAGNNLTVTLAALGLLDNGETIKSLQQKVDQSIKAAFDKQLQLSSKLDIAEGKLQVADEALRLAVSHNTTEQERLWELKKEQGQLQIAIKNLEDKKKILADNGNGDKGKIKQEIETIKGKINTTDAQIKDLTQKITDGLALVARYDNLIIQGNTAQEKANYHNQFVQRWDVVGYESGRSGKKKEIYGWVTNQEQVNLRDGYQNQANQFRAEANSIQGSVDYFNKNKSILQETKQSKNNELWLLYHELDAKNNLLSFVGTRSDNELALVNLQLDQGKEDLQQLEKTEIPSQEKAAQATNLKVTQAQSDLDKLKTDKVSAQKNLDNFVKDNKELLTTDLSLGLLKDAITKVQNKIASLKGDLAKPNQSATTIKGLNEAIAVEQGKLGQLKQQYQLLGLEALEINQGRLESFNQQQATENSVNDAVKVNTIEGYVVLLPQLVQQMTGLSDVWGENLKQNHGFTVEVNNLFQNNLTAFDGLTKYIGDKFAVPYSDYSLNKIQLDDAIAIQDTQVKYRDALAQAVDDLGENIALQKKAVEQADALSGKLNHIRDLRSFEQGYGDLQTALSKLASVDKADYESSDQKVKKIAEDLLKKLEGNEQYKLVADKLRLALNNYKTFATANLLTYTNKYQGYLDIQKNQIDDVKNIQDEKDLKSQEAITKWQAVRSDVTGNYYFLTPARDWSGAQAIAQSAGGNLVTINNQDEQNWLFQRYKSYVWIGLSDHIQEGVWRWVSGEPVTYTNWLPNQPDNWDGIEDFVQLNLTGDGRWNDLPHVGIHNGNIPGIVELNFQKYDQQIQAVNDKATADKARVAGELQSLHDQGIKVLISQTAEALRPLLIDEVNEEVTNKIADLPNQIDLKIGYKTFTNTANGHIYFLTGITVNDAAAQAEGDKYGGYLVKVDDEQERQWITDTFGAGYLPPKEGAIQIWERSRIIEIDSQQVVDQKLKQQEQWIETNLQKYIEQKQKNFTEAYKVKLNQINYNRDILAGIIKYNPQNGNYYTLTKSTTWTDAQAEAKSLGGNLITINNADEQQWILNTFGTTGNYWIGLKKNLDNGAWEWINGEKVNYLNWSPNEPNGEGIENYGMIIGDQDVNFAQGKWNDYTNASILRGQSIQGIIEIDPNKNDYKKLAKYNAQTGKYYVLSKITTWTEAQAEAQRLGGNLVTINNADEQRWILNNFGTTGNYWIGLKKNLSNVSWEWVNGEAVNYLNWSPNEPNNGGGIENYGMIIGDQDVNFAQGKWNDWTNDSILRGQGLRGIIEIDANIFDQQTKPIQEQAISNLQNLRLETAYLTLQSEKDPDKLQKYLQEYQFNQLTLNNIQFTPTVQSLADNNLIGDFNNDKINDTYHHWNVSGANELYLGNSDGSFTKYINPISTTAINESPTNIFTGDFNGDGKDFNGDGKSDLYFYWKASGRNRLYISNGNGTFTQYLDPITTTLITGSPDQIQVNDFNNDGNADIRFQWTASNTIRTFLSKGNSTFVQSLSSEEIRNKYYPELNQADTLANLQQQINKEIGDSEKQIADLQSEITRKNSESAAALSQATWYEEQAATHWQLSRKAGPTWTEQRQDKGKSGKSKTVTITHVDHNWIIWDTYSKQAVSLREHSANLLKGVETDTTNQNTASEILKQWQAANAVADETSLTQAQLTTLLNQLDAQFKLNADKKQQIADWEKLLPTLQSQLDQAIKNAKTAQGNVSKEWTEYQTSQKTYQNALADVLPRRVELNIQGQQLLQEINAVQTWVNQQNTLLTEEITQVETLITQLKNQQNNIPTNLPENQSLTLKTLLDQSIQLLTQKQIVLSAQQATFLQKQTLLNTQKKVIETQYQLLDAYLESPDNDTSNLEKLLTDTQKTLAEVQKLAEQAEASSNALTALMDDVQASLLLQNDKYLSAIKDKQQTLQDLLKATELKENYTLQATEKQIQLNGLQTQLIDLLKKANDAGSKEAAKLLEVAKYNDFATVAELYHRDYRDLANDKGGSSSKGIARPEDLQLADYYYNEMLKYRQLKTEAEQQIAEFTQIRTLAESQITAIQQQQGLAAEELAQLNKSIGNSQEQIDAKQEELAIAQFRIDALSQIRNWTEQTVAQLLLVEKLNFAQAKLEQDIANNRQYLIDDTVKFQLDKQRLDIERDRQIAITKLEQLNQIKTEEALQTAINDLRSDLGANPIEEIIKQADYKGELAGILADLDALQQRQPNLPQEIKTLLTATTQDIHTALQGKETKTIQDNLLKTATALVEQANKLNAEVAKLDQEEQKYIALLQQSETNLKSATKSLYDEIKNGQVSDQEKALINAKNLEILYQIGYAKGAVDLSSELAKQSKTILEQIIQGRIQERKARKKAFVNEIIGTVTLVISAASAVLTAGASLGINAALGLSAGTISSITATLNTINTSLSVLQAAYNGDWSTAIFRAGLSLAGSLGDIAGLSPQTVTALKTSINSAYVAYKGGDSIAVLLSAIQGVGAIAADGIDLSDLSKVSDAKTLLITASQISTVVHSGIQAIENGDVLKGIQALGQALGTISKNFSLGLEEVAKQQLEELTGLGWEKLNKIIDLGGNAYNAIKNGAKRLGMK
ncbi:MAG: hypothetical protein GPJ18_18240 [Microcystis aeruginosa F13-15]|nr:hypothetical protein [Microcystis aeruginosa F13-15]